jgi:aminoglycoside phosphotransferase
MPASGSIDDVEVPMAVLSVAAGRPVRPVWKNETGGLTFKVTGAAPPVFVKWQPAGTEVDLGAEAERLEWARMFTPGTADRWADLAVATWSAGWNYGPGWGDQLLAAYGVRDDPVRTRYYRLLWDLGP